MCQSTSSTKHLALLCCGIFLMAAFHTGDAETPEEIAEKALGSTVLLVLEDANGQPMSLGSGFFVREGEIASNLHVVEGASWGYAKVVGQKTKYDIEGVSGIDLERDLVLLKISAPETLPLSLGNSDSVQVGEPVYAVGNPQGLEGTFSQGIVSSIREVGSDKLLQITAPISPGSSGGPVLNSKGEVIGVSVATFRGGQNLNFAIPSNYLKTLVAEAGSAKPFAAANFLERQGSILVDLGGDSSESVVGTQFRWNDSRYRGYYTFSVRNNLRQSVRNVVCLVIFYGNDDLPIETELAVIKGPVGGNLARRSKKLGRFNADEVRYYTAEIEIRVLDFELAE